MLNKKKSQLNRKKRLLNLGCGNKFHEDWINIDLISYSKHVVQYNILKKIPLPDDFVEVVYHSQVLEHIPKDKSEYFIKECYRVLQPGGIIRIVVPDLENIIQEYCRILKECLEKPSALTRANYEWITIELFDQMIRNQTGGLMKEYLSRENLINKKYVLERSGAVGEYINKSFQKSNLDKIKDKIEEVGYSVTLRKILKSGYGTIKGKIFGEKYKLGNFRLSGEVHMWMYDRFSLTELLTKSGFQEIKVKSPFDSDIPNWEDYQLDVKNGKPYDPTSLFVEARK